MMRFLAVSLQPTSSLAKFANLFSQFAEVKYLEYDPEQPWKAESHAHEEFDAAFFDFNGLRAKEIEHLRHQLQLFATKPSRMLVKMPVYIDGLEHVRLADILKDRLFNWNPFPLGKDEDAEVIVGWVQHSLMNQDVFFNAAKVLVIKGMETDAPGLCDRLKAFVERHSNGRSRMHVDIWGGKNHADPFINTYPWREYSAIILTFTPDIPLGRIEAAARSSKYKGPVPCLPALHVQVHFAALCSHPIFRRRVIIIEKENGDHFVDYSVAFNGRAKIPFNTVDEFEVNRGNEGVGKELLTRLIECRAAVLPVSEAP